MIKNERAKRNFTQAKMAELLSTTVRRNDCGGVLRQQFERREQLLDEQILIIKKEMEDAEGEKQKLNSALEIMTSVLKERKLGNGQLIMIINRILVKDAGDKMVDIKLELKAKYAQHIHEPPERKQVQREDITALAVI